MKNCPFCAEEIQDLAIVCKHCRRELGPVKPSRGVKEQLEKHKLSVLLGVLVAVALGMSFPYMFYDTNSTRSAALEVPSSVLLQLGNGAMQIPAADHLRWTWTTDVERPYCRLSGRVVGTQGGNRDFDVFVFDADGYMNWRNGLSASVYYQSGRTSAVTIDETVGGAGTEYYLVVSNEFSSLTTKHIRSENVKVVCSAR